MTKSLPGWLSYLESIHPKAIDFGLDRVTQVADRLGVRQFNCPVVTVGGTNGKGSTIAFLSSIYRQAGYKVGAYTSPHLLRFNERICIHGYPISDTGLCVAFEAVEKVREEITLTYFEAVTLAAFYLFQKAQLDVVLLEVGLGGRLDAVNCVDADISVITTISLDHTNYLGSSRDNIAHEKAGIFRSGRPAICGDLNPPETLFNYAKKLGAPLHLLGRDFSMDEASRNWSWRGKGTFYSNLPKPHLPLQNAATSLAVIGILQNSLPVSKVAVEEGLKKTSLPGRFQTVQNSPRVIVDVAHNPESGTYLAKRLQSELVAGWTKRAFPSEEAEQVFASGLAKLRRTYAVVAMLEDKDQENTILPLLPFTDAWFIAPLFEPRGSSGQRLHHFLQRASASSTLCASVRDAYSKALKRATVKDKVIVFGSFHTVSAVLPACFWVK